MENADEEEDGAGGASKEDSTNDEIFCKGGGSVLEALKVWGFSVEASDSIIMI